MTADEPPSPPPALRELLLTHSIVLGSQSSSRCSLLRAAGVPFTARATNIDEKAIRCAEPRELVLALARAKAEALLPHLPARLDGKTVLLLTADQVVVHEGRVLEKPDSEDEARAFVRGYSNSSASTVGGLRVTNVESGFWALDEATVYFGELPSTLADALLLEGALMHCAGGLMAEHPLVTPHVLRTQGGLDSVMGLGLASASRLLLEAAASPRCTTL